MATPEKRRVSTRVRVGKRVDPSPEPPKSEQRRKKIKKIHAKKSSDSQAGIKSDITHGTPNAQDAFSAHPSPTPLSSKINKNLPLPVRPAGASSENEGGRHASLQSIAESGVLAASISRSRANWINDGIFERYWSKPKKSRGQLIEVPNNPPKDSMVTLGRSKLFIEPHVFDVAIYGIRNPLPNTPLSTNPSLSSPLSNVIAPSAAVSPANPGPTQAQPRPFQGATPAPVTPTLNTSPPAQQLQPQKQASRPTPAAQQSQNRPQPTSTASVQENQTPNDQVPQQVQQPSQARASGQDPVIQMLAQRASENPGLKALMKIVASGQANKDQLAEFQRHIDELTRILQQRNALQQAPTTSDIPTSGSLSGPAQVPSTPNNPSVPPANATPLSSSSNVNSQAQQPTPPSTQPLQHTPSNSTLAQPRSQPPPPTARPVKTPLPTTFPAWNRFKGIALEFLNPTAACNSTPNDRLLFPKNTLLAYHPDGRSVTASFLVVKNSKSSNPVSSTPSTPAPPVGKKIHVPISILFEPSDQQVLSYLRAGVAPEAEVRKHMDDVVRETEREIDVQLALQLPLSEKHNTERSSPPETVALVGRRGRKKEVEDLHGLCRFCYGPLPESSEHQKQDQVVCRECAKLKEKESGNRKVFVPLARRDVKPGSVLVW